MLLNGPLWGTCCLIELAWRKSVNIDNSCPLFRRFDTIIVNQMFRTRDEYYKAMKYLPAQCSFRECQQYNNLMYSAAGRIMEKIEGKTWEQMIQEKIFGPLQMTSSTTDLYQAIDTGRLGIRKRHWIWLGMPHLLVSCLGKELPTPPISTSGSNQWALLEVS